MIQSPLLQEIYGHPQGLAVRNPANGELLAHVPISGAHETVTAIEKVQRSMEKNSSPNERAQWLQGIADRLQSNQEEFARLITLEQGKPLKEGRAEVEYAAGFFSFFAQQAHQLKSRGLPVMHGAGWHVHYRAAGVAALITPWNFPLAMLAKKFAPALLAGCGIVIKPAEDTPLSAIALCEVARQSGAPQDRVHWLTGDPAPIGEILCSHSAVRVVSFTGSTEIGQKLSAQCTPHIKRLALELGGNAPFIVFEDADIETAANALLSNKFRCAGQTCVCANRVYVHESVVDKFIETIIQRVAKLKVGDGMREDTDIGPLINRAGWNKVHRLVQEALRAGAQLRWGELMPEPEHDWGCYFSPVVMAGCRDNMALFREETFGPVIAISTFNEAEDVLTRANATRYGLAAYVFSRNETLLAKCCEILQFGHLALNSGTGPTPEAPFGGMKFSGLGREGGDEGLMEYIEIQTVVNT